ncbi:ABC transporter permease [Microbacterium schleiferi]|uniref:ABC transporter permease n=1 Tax=Microbacterium schleiferi TaxID=69362 RepID=A0A7S8MYZ1_9MICO|nr:ABC transporter permease [Microbacterium schleiferi]QPE05233.1 ABC transporter permease [Microbacterium schleiferi]
MSGLVGALLEAWAELRHHKLRVLLSLVGIAVSVAALTAVVALGEYQRQYAAEQSDRYGGRVATISVSGMSSDGSPMDWDRFDAQVMGAAARFDLSYISRVAQTVTLQVQTPDWVRPVPATLVDPAYPVIHRSTVAEGRWFVPGDGDLLAPPMVISFPLWTALGSPPLASHPTLQVLGTAGGTFPVVGVTPREGEWDNNKQIWMLYDGYRDRVDALPADTGVIWELWAPEEITPEVGALLASDVRAAAGDGVEVIVNRTDWGSRPDAQNASALFEIITGSIAVLILLLGGLGLVNIQLVAMRQRIREIGVRRSFGATAGRIFTAVLLESVVATAVAGVVGIVLAVAILRTPMVLTLFGGMQDLPGFPVRAAVTGLVAAIAIGALAGFLPALVAVRARVIDTLRV